MLSIGQLIKLTRINKKLAQEDLAINLKVSKNYISLIENNKKDPSINFLKDVANFLEIPLILLMWEKLGMPDGKTKEEKAISKQLEKMLQEAQKSLFENTFFKKHEKKRKT